MFLRPHINYGNVIYDQSSNESFCKKLGSVQYKAALAITGAMQDTSIEKSFMELGWESLKLRRCFRSLCCMFKKMKNQALEYLNNLIPKHKQTQEIFIFQVTIVKQSILNLIFFSTSLEKWFHLDPSIRNSDTIIAFKQKLLLFIRPSENIIFDIFYPHGLKLLIRLRLNAYVHRFWHNFQYCLNPLGACSLETGNTSHYLLHCHHNFPFLIDLTNSVKTFAANFESLSDSRKVESGNSRHDDDKSNSILSASIYYIKNTKRFDCSLCD